MHDNSTSGIAEANKAATAAMGEIAWPTIMLGICLVSSYVALLAGLLAGVLPLWVVFWSIVIIVYAAYTIVHEAVHGSICGTHTSIKWLNEGLGFLAAQILGAPFTAHRKEHMQHHRRTNFEGEDPDLEIAGGSFRDLFWGTLRALPLQIEYYVEHHWSTASKQDRIALLAELVISIVWRIAFVVLAGWQTALLLLVIANLAGFFVTIFLFAWIVHRPHTQTGRFRDTATFIFPGFIDDVVSILWLFQNYHSIHHLYPRIPFYRYRQVFHQIEPTMQEHHAPIMRVGWDADLQSARKTGDTQ